MKTIDRSDKGKSGIYIITNKANGKVYIGQSINLWLRINEGYLQKLPKNKGHNIHLQRAWNKYGKESFTFEVLEYVLDVEKLNEVETSWIKFYDASNKKFGYNIFPEGNSPRGRTMSEEFKKKIKIINSGSNNGMYGQTHTDEVKEIISKANSIPIVQLDIEGQFVREWRSVTEAAEYYGVARAPITSVVRKKTTTSCGFIWVYKKEYEENKFNLFEHLKRKKDLRRGVVQFTMDGKYISEFDSITKAQLFTKTRNIVSACQGHMKHAGGCKWMYKDEYEKYGYKNKYREKEKKTRSIVQISLDLDVVKIWSSIEEASKELGVARANIRNVCNGKLNTSAGFIWMFEDEYILNGIDPKNNSLNSKFRPVVQLSLDNEYIATFKSIKEAKENTKIVASNITAVCKGKNKTAGGYNWIYLEEWENEQNNIVINLVAT